MVLFILWVLVGGCRYFNSDTRITLIFPALPAQWEAQFKSVNFRVVYPASEGNLHEMTIEGEKAFSGTVAIDLEKCINLPVIAYPIPEGFVPGRRLKAGEQPRQRELFPAGLLPAGGLFPLHRDSDGSLRLSWEYGFVAELLLNLLIHGVPIEAINTPRLITEIVNRAEGDTWSLDSSRIARSFSLGGFRADYIKKCETHKLTVDGLTGRWISGNPFFPVFSADERGIINFSGLYNGFHRFFQQGSRDIMDILITDNEWFILKHWLETGESGLW
ncbi:MAG: hypothetical protein AB1798_07745 [Spirochaetota bacterium]